MKLKKIVVTEKMDLSETQLGRLQALAEVVRYDDAPSLEQWLERARDADAICSGKLGLSTKDDSGIPGIYQLPKGAFVSHPFVNVAWVDAKRLEKLGVTLSYAPGCNRDAVGEWILYMLIELFREFRNAVNKADPAPALKRTRSIAGKSVAILGMGNVGYAVAERCNAFKMKVTPFGRGDKLEEVVAGCDAVVNCLSSREENRFVLGEEFFSRDISPGAVFVSMTSPTIYSLDALLVALDAGRVAGAGIDIGSGFPGDINNENYQRVLAHPRILATPQIAHFSDYSAQISYDMMIENIEAYASGAEAKNIWRG